MAEGIQAVIESGLADARPDQFAMDVTVQELSPNLPPDLTPKSLTLEPKTRTLAADLAVSERVLVLSPWGVGGGYSGPVVLMDRLFGQLYQQYNLSIDVLYRDRGQEVVPDWVSRAFPIAAGTRERFQRLDQMKWVVQAAAFMMRHAKEYAVIHLQGAYWTTCFPASFTSSSRLSVLPVLEAGDLSKATILPQRILEVFARRRVFSKTRATFCLSQGISTECSAAGCPAHTLVPIGNPVDTSRFYPCQPARLPRPVRLGFAGKLGDKKQPHLIASAVAKLQSLGIDTSALFIGPFESDSYEHKFMMHVEAIGVKEHIKVTGYVKDVAPLMRNEIDIFILPSKSEGMPGALAEAMACGIPAIVTDVGEMGNAVTASRSGHVIEPNVQDIVDAVVRVVSDPNEYEAMAEAATSYARRHFSAEVIAERFYEAMLPAGV